jgi:RNA polymerase sigma-70 factor, ECF subfamily
LGKIGSSNLMERTPVSLLERVCKHWDQDAWQRFVELYSPLMFNWARRQGLQPADCADLTQDVFTTLCQILPEFTYERHKSFRAWLRTVTLNHWRDRCKRAANRPLPGNEGLLSELECPDDLAVLAEDEYRQHLVGRALKIMRTDFEPATWQAFWEHGVQRRPAAEVAAELGLTVAAVYCGKVRVLHRLRQELRGLLD